MKTGTKTLLAALMLLAISYKKESNSIQSAGIADEGATQVPSTDANELVRAGAVRIGNQVWKKKNLDVSRYRNGDVIPQVYTRDKWNALTTGAWCWYNNDSANGAVYGKLYNWYAVNDRRGLAPEGWHIPSDPEWRTLGTFLGKNAGGKMKSTGTIEDGTGLWHQPNEGATNRSGFTALPGGFRGGFFGNIGYVCFLWSSTESDTGSAIYWQLEWDGSDFGWIPGGKNLGFSVRCVRD